VSGTLSHTPADIVRRVLIALSGGTLPSASGAWPIYCGTLPDEPDAAAVVTDTAGTIDGHLQPGGEAQEHYGVQVTVRNAVYDTGHDKANALAILLDQSVRLTAITIGSSDYVVYAITRSSGVLHAGRDAGRDAGSKRHLFTLNAVVSLRQTA